MSGGGGFHRPGPNIEVACFIHQAADGSALVKHTSGSNGAHVIEMGLPNSSSAPKTHNVSFAWTYPPNGEGPHTSKVMDSLQGYVGAALDGEPVVLCPIGPSVGKTHRLWRSTEALLTPLYPAFIDELFRAVGGFSEGATGGGLAAGAPEMVKFTASFVAVGPDGDVVDLFANPSGSKKVDYSGPFSPEKVETEILTSAVAPSTHPPLPSDEESKKNPPRRGAPPDPKQQAPPPPPPPPQPTTITFTNAVAMQRAALAAHDAMSPGVSKMYATAFTLRPTTWSSSATTRVSDDVLEVPVCGPTTRRLSIVAGEDASMLPALGGSNGSALKVRPTAAQPTLPAASNAPRGQKKPPSTWEERLGTVIFLDMPGDKVGPDETPSTVENAAPPQGAVGRVLRALGDVSGQQKRTLHRPAPHQSVFDKELRPFDASIPFAAHPLTESLQWALGGPAHLLLMVFTGSNLSAYPHTLLSFQLVSRALSTQKLPLCAPSVRLLSKRDAITLAGPVPNRVPTFAASSGAAVGGDASAASAAWGRASYRDRESAHLQSLADAEEAAAKAAASAPSAEEARLHERLTYEVAVPATDKWNLRPRVALKRPPPRTGLKVRSIRNNTQLWQPTINLAASGDVIMVESGVYVDNVVMTTKNITILAADGADVTLDSNNANPAFCSRTQYVRLEGIKLTSSGNAETALVVDLGTGEFVDCNVAGGNGGAAIHGNADPLFVKCKFSQSRRGFGVNVSNSRPIFEQCEISQNHDGGMIVESAGNPYLRGCIFRDGRGSGAVILDGGQGAFVDCKFIENACVGLLVQAGGAPVVRGCRFTGGVGSGTVVQDRAVASYESCSFARNGSHDVECIRAGAPTLVRCTFEGGPGSAIACANGATPTVDGCSFVDYETAAIAVRERAAPIVKDCNFSRGANCASACGVLASDNAKGEITNCTFKGWSPNADGGSQAISAKPGSAIVISGNQVYAADGTRQPSRPQSTEKGSDSIPALPPTGPKRGFAVGQKGAAPAPSGKPAGGRGGAPGVRRCQRALIRGHWLFRHVFWCDCVLWACRCCVCVCFCVFVLSNVFCTSERGRSRRSWMIWIRRPYTTQATSVCTLNFCDHVRLSSYI